MILKWIQNNIIILLVMFISNTLIADCGECETDNFNENIQSFYLPQNGLKVILKEERSMPMIGMSLFYNVGSHDEPAGIKGMTKLQTYLFKEAEYSNGISSSDVKEKIKKLTVSNSLDCDRDIFSSTYEFNKNHIEDILKIEADRMTLLEITDSSLVRSKRKLKSDGDAEFSGWLRKQTGQLNRFQEDHPYVASEWGNIDEIDTISVQTAIEYREKYFNPNNATLVLVGDFQSANIVGIVNSMFGHIKNKSSVPIDPEFAINDKDHVLLDDLEELEKQEVLYAQIITCNINIPSYRNDDMIILEHVLNALKYDIALGGNYSKTYTNKLGFLTWPHMSPALGPSESMFIVANFFSRKSHKRLKKKLKQMIIRLSENGFSEDYLNKYKKRELISDYKKGYEYKNAAWDLGRAELVLGDYNHYNRTTKILERLTNDDIKRVVSEYLLNQDIHTIEIIWGKRHWYTPIFYFFSRIARIIGQKEINKLVLTRDESMFF